MSQRPFGMSQRVACARPSGVRPFGESFTHLAHYQLSIGNSQYAYVFSRLSNDDSPLGLSIKGQSAFQLGKLNEAYDCFKQAYDKNPNDTDNTNNLDYVKKILTF